MRARFTSILQRVFQTAEKESSSKLLVATAGECQSDTHPFRSECVARGDPLRAGFALQLFPAESAPAVRIARYSLLAWTRKPRRQSVTGARWVSLFRPGGRRRRLHCRPPVRGAALP